MKIIPQQWPCSNSREIINALKKKKDKNSKIEYNYFEGKRWIYSLGPVKNGFSSKGLCQARTFPPQCPHQHTHEQRHLDQQFTALKITLLSIHRAIIQASIRNYSVPLIGDAGIKTCWAPVHEQDVLLGFDCVNGSIHIIRHHITTKQKTTSHVFSVVRSDWLKANICDLSH